MKIQVYGSGCARCKMLYEAVADTVKNSGLPENVEYITDVARMVEAGIMHGPALVIDGKIAVAGRVPAEDELKEIIAKHK